MTANGLSRRVDALEDALLRSMAARIAAEYGLPTDELLGDARRMAAEEHRLRARGFSEREVSRGLMAWVAADLGVDAAKLEVNWEWCLQGDMSWLA